MTVQAPVLRQPDSVPPHLLAAPGLIGPLIRLAMAALALAGVTLTTPYWISAAWLSDIRPLGLLGLMTGSLLLAAFGLIACLTMVLWRRRQQAAPGAAHASASVRRTSGWPTMTMALLFSAAAAASVLSNWPSRQMTEATLLPSSGFASAAALLLLAAPFLLAERYLGTIGTEQLPEVTDLRALVFLPGFFLSAEAVLQPCVALGFGTLYWIRIVLSLALLGVCAELAVRALATWFLPPRDAVAARAPLASTLAGLMNGRALSPARLGSTIRSQFGMDFSRSWALRFMRAAALPVVLLMVVSGWLLTGVTRIGLNERGSYERIGIPIAMLQPGLHLVLPFPFGLVRHLELGVIHTVSITYGDQAAATEAVESSTAEGDAPASASRLWDAAQPADVSYVIASGEQERQSFQTVSASVRILYRIGRTDTEARAALYRAIDPAGLVEARAGRLLAQFFATQTLAGVLGESQRKIASNIQAELQTDLDALGTGTEIVSVIIEAVHPPSGAASAYRGVQAAEIAATTEIASERGHAQTTTGVAGMNAHSAIDDAQASAAETISSARVDLTGIIADERPFRADSQSFLLERYLTNIKTALRQVPLQIVDHRLNGSSRPTIDLRPPSPPHDDWAVQPGKGEAKP